MATPEEFVQYVCAQIGGTGQIRYRKMFGEYLVYVDEKPILLVCDSTVYVKPYAELAPLLGNAPRGIPYEGAKEQYVLQIDDADLSRKAVALLLELTPLPKKKKK